MDAEIGKKAHEYVAVLMDKARSAQRTAEGFTQEKVDELATAIAWTAVKEDNARMLAEMAVAETGLGNYKGKYTKLIKKTRGVLWDMKYARSVGVIETDEKKSIIKIAKPVGVIGAILPCTNPCITPVLKAMWTIKTRNAAVFCPHPRSKKTTVQSIDLLRETLKEYNAPEDLLVCVEQPTIDISNEVMRQCDLIVATGGSSMVKAAYSSGKPAYGVGVGNAVSVIDETADVKDAAHKIMLSKTNDLATGCSTENSLVIHESIYDSMLDALIKEGGYLVKGDEKNKLESTMWVDERLNPAVIAQSAARIARLAGIDLPEDRTFIIVPETGTGREYPFSGEKLSVVLTVYKYREFKEAIKKVNSIQAYMGTGHSCGIHSFDEDHIMKLSLGTKTSRVMVRQPQNYGNAGDWCNGMPWTTTLGCGTWGGNITSENITWKHFLNITRVSFPVKPEIPSDEELFGDIMREG